MTNAKKTIIITGASSGLGVQLAIKYSAGGNNLFLIARSEERLNETAKICRNNGANVTNIIADVTEDRKSVLEAKSETDCGGRARTLRRQQLADK